MCKQECSVAAKYLLSTKKKANFESLRHRQKFSKVTYSNHRRIFANITLHWLLHKHRGSPILKCFLSKRKTISRYKELSRNYKETARKLVSTNTSFSTAAACQLSHLLHPSQQERIFKMDLKEGAATTEVLV